MSETLPSASERPVGFFDSVAGLFIAPTQAFKRILPKPRFWMPLLALVALNMGFTGIWLSKVEPRQFMKNAMEESGAMDRIPPEKFDEIVEMQSKFMRISAFAGGLVFLPLMIVVLGAFFMFVYRFFYGSDLRFGQSMGVVAWSMLIPGLVGTPLLLLTYVLKGDWNLVPDMVLQANLSMVFDRMTTGKFLYSLAKSLDLFAFWVIVLLSAGFGAASKRTAGAAAMGVVLPWLVLVLGKAAFASLF